MSSDSLEDQCLSYAADIVVAVTFGIYVTLAAICIHFLLQRRSSARSHRVVLWYTVTLLLTGTIWFISGAWFGELELVELSPSVIGQFSSPKLALYTRVTLVKNVTYTLNIYLADSLLVYRLFIIWGRSIMVAVIPGLVWLAVVATGIATLVLTSRPNANFQAPYIINSETAFICLSIALNILCTLLIAGRLVVQRQVAKQLGSTGAKAYTSVAVVVVESAALYSLFGIIYIPLMVLQKPVQFPFSSLIGTLTLIAPNLIVLRMALTPAGGPTAGVGQGATFPDFGGFKAARTPGTTIGAESGIMVSQVTVTESRMVSDTLNSVESAEMVDNGVGHSAERLMEDGEKVRVKVQNGHGVWAVVV
ncbi:hypothetical protein V8D89_008731 [Ganoderma adspersum]